MHRLHARSRGLIALLGLSLTVMTFAPGSFDRSRSTGLATAAQQSPQQDRASIALPALFRSAALAELPVPVPVTPEAPTLPPAPTRTPPLPTATATRTETPGPTIEPPTATTEPPTATDAPTATPTEEIAPTATPTPEPTKSPVDCVELVANGDFELGATKWQLRNPSPRYDRRVARVIKQVPSDFVVQPTSGTWLAELGGGTGGFLDELISPDETTRGWLLPPPAEMVSATLRFRFSAATNQARNRQPDDRFTVALVNDDQSERFDVLTDPLSEETTQNGQWRAYKVEVGQYLTQRRRWDRAKLVFKSENGETDATWHYLEDVSLTMCTRAASGIRRTRPRADQSERVGDEHDEQQADPGPPEVADDPLAGGDDPAQRLLVADHREHGAIVGVGPALDVAQGGKERQVVPHRLREPPQAHALQDRGADRACVDPSV